MSIIHVDKMKLSLNDIARITNGELFYSSSQIIKNLSLDSREIEEGTLFIAIKGERFDGHDYIGDAFAEPLGRTAENVLTEGFSPERICLETEAARNAALLATEYDFDDLQDILDQFAAWFQEYYNIDAGGELKAESVMEIIDGIQEYMDALKGLEMVIGKKPAVKVIKSNTKPSADDTINQFLKQMGW